MTISRAMSPTNHTYREGMYLDSSSKWYKILEKLLVASAHI